MRNASVSNSLLHPPPQATVASIPMPLNEFKATPPEDCPHSHAVNALRKPRGTAARHKVSLSGNLAVTLGNQRSPQRAARFIFNPAIRRVNKSAD